MHWLLFICTGFEVYLSFIFCQPVVLWHNETWKRFTEIYCIWHWEQFRSIQFRALLSYTLNSWLLDCPGLHKNSATWISSHTLMLLKQIKYSLSSLDAVKLDELLTLDEWLWWVGIGLPTTISEKLIEENIHLYSFYWDANLSLPCAPSTHDTGTQDSIYDPNALDKSSFLLHWDTRGVH